MAARCGSVRDCNGAGVVSETAGKGMVHGVACDSQGACVAAAEDAWPRKDAVAVLVPSACDDSALRKGLLHHGAVRMRHRPRCLQEMAALWDASVCHISRHRQIRYGVGVGRVFQGTGSLLDMAVRWHTRRVSHGTQGRAWVALGSRGVEAGRRRMGLGHGTAQRPRTHGRVLAAPISVVLAPQHAAEEAAAHDLLLQPAWGGVRTWAGRTQCAPAQKQKWWLLWSRLV